MAVGWTLPFAGKADQVARVVHSPKGALAVVIISVWPYFLMALGGYFGFAGATLLKRRLSAGG